MLGVFLCVDGLADVNTRARLQVVLIGDSGVGKR